MKKQIAWLMVTVSLFIGGVVYTHYSDAQTAAKPAVTEAAKPTAAPVAKTAAKKKTATTKPVKTQVTVTYQKHEVVKDPSTQEVYTRSYPLQENTITIDESTPSAVDPIVKQALGKQGYTSSSVEEGYPPIKPQTPSNLVTIP